MPSAKKGSSTKKSAATVEAPTNVISTNENIQLVIDETNDDNSKKRGRKPRGNKLISKNSDQNLEKEPVTNIILHLKCSTSDLEEYNVQLTKLITDPLEYNPSVPPSILTYNDEKLSLLSYENNSSSRLMDKSNYAYGETDTKSITACRICSQRAISDNTNSNNSDGNEDDGIHLKDINSKLKKLKINLYRNTNADKKSACFWCTYEFDNPACYIPKYELDGQLCGYGSFCRPECAVAYLMKENLDDSTKFERYHLLNQIYSKIYEFKKNIKPAPSPHYILDKFYGSLSIQEYRKLLKTEHMLLTVDKPMTRILPELHEDNDEFILNVYGGSKTVASQQGTYKVKRQSEKQQGPSKNSIMRDKFGI
jgi:hypothetical protein